MNLRPEERKKEAELYKAKTKIAKNIISNSVDSINFIGNSAINIVASIEEVMKIQSENMPKGMEMQLVAGSILSTAGDIIGEFANLIPNPLVQAVSGTISFALAFISEILGNYETSVYYYKVDDKGTFYKWDGGLTHSRFWGFLQQPIRTKDDMKMIKPILLGLNENYDNKKYYFNNQFRSDEVDVIIDNIKYKIQNNINDETTSIVHYIEPLHNTSELIQFDYSKLNEENTKNIDDFLTHVWGKNASINAYYNYLDKNEYNYKYVNGVLYSKEDYSQTFVDKIIKNIKSTTIIQMPFINKLNVPIDQLEFDFNNNPKIANKIFKMPGQVWYSLNSNLQIPDNEDYNYLIYNPITLKDNMLTDEEIKSTLKKDFFNRINVLEKITTYEDFLSNNNFSDLNTHIVEREIYIVDVNSLLKKFFLSKEKAYEYLYKSINYKENTISKSYIEWDYKNQIFASEQELKNWVIHNSSKYTDYAVNKERK